MDTILWLNVLYYFTIVMIAAVAAFALWLVWYTLRRRNR